MGRIKDRVVERITERITGVVVEEGVVEEVVEDTREEARSPDQTPRSRDQTPRRPDQVPRSRDQTSRGPDQAPKSPDQEALESDARIERMDRVAVLFGEITAATREFLAALAGSDRHRDWEKEGFGSCAEWLAWRTGITRGTANEKVRAARALEDLPLISEAMARGELSFSKVRAITRVATPDNEAELLDFARAGSAANLERLVRGWKTLSRFDEQRAERIRHSRRCFSVFPDEDGMYVVRGRLDPEVGAALMRAIEAASDALFAGGSRRSDERRGGEERQRPEERRSDEAKRSHEAPEPAQLRADAVGLLAERALAAGFGNGFGFTGGFGAGSGTGNEVGSRVGNGTGPGAGDAAPVSGSRAERYQVVLHVEAATLAEEGDPGLSELEDGTRVSAETARRLACDASRVEVRHESGSVASSAKGSPNGSANGSAHGSVLDVGRKTRTIPPALRRALDARDRGCRFPACGLRFTDAHHIVHWADGGETKLDNTVLLCRTHHRRVHEGGYRVCIDRAGQVVFFTPRGGALFEAPPMPELPHPHAPGDRMCLQALVRGNRERGVTPGVSSGAPKWKRDSDIPWTIEAAAIEALDPWDEPGAKEAKTDEPAADEPKTDESKTDEPAADEPEADELAAHEPKANEPETEEPAAEAA